MTAPTFRQGTASDLGFVRGLERELYPRVMRQMQSVRNWEDLAEYCEATPSLWVWQTGYLILTEDEVVDLAATQIPVGVMVALLRQMRRHFRGRTFQMDAREGTSWRLIQALINSGRLHATETEVWHWGGESFHAIDARWTA